MLGLFFLTLSFQTADLPDAVLTSDAAHLIGEPLLAIGQSVDDFSVSPDGQFVVALRKVRSVVPVTLDRPTLPIVGRELAVWNRATGRTQSIVVEDNVSDSLLVTWIPNSAFAIVTQTDSTIEKQAGGELVELYGMASKVLDARTLSVKDIKKTNDMYVTRWSYHPSPVASLAIEVSYRAQYGRKAPGSDVRVYQSLIVLRAIGPTGALGRSVSLGEGYFNVGSSDWSVDGSEFLIETTKIDSEGRGRVVIQHFNPATGDLYESTEPIAPRREPAAQKLFLVPKTVEAVNGDEESSVTSWWLSVNGPSQKATALVAHDALGAVVSDDGSLVAYRLSGAVFVRQLTRVTLEQYRQAWEATERAKIMSRAKQVALAAVMYAADHKDDLPPNLDPMRDLMTYLKNPDLVAGFVWVFKGGNTREISNVTEEVMGYIPGPGGRVVVYMDTHVKWVPD